MNNPRLRLAGILVLALLLAASAHACGGGGKDKPEETPTGTPGPTSTASDLASAVVQIVALDADRNTVWTGSGTVIRPEGLILTNGHVVDDRASEYDVLGIAVTTRTDEPPEPTYLAEIAAVDYTLDLAVVRIVSDLDGGDVTVDLPTIPVGDSGNVEIGDHVRIMGYPGIGGETITLTEGTVSGFTAQREIAQRAWIKTDATISGGNSGGLALNDGGEIIGVPTIAGSSEETDPVDCRFVTDTNRDGVVDEQDTCVPIGGFINGLRPIALAIPLLAAAGNGEEYVSAFPERSVEPAADFDPANVIFDDIVFSNGVTPTDEPAAVVTSYTPGPTEVCAFWDYEAMLDGVSWEALWFVDGELDEEGSITDDTWIGGDAGNWWVCITDDQGLPDGLYELVMSVEGEFQNSDSVFVGGDHPLVDVELENAAATEVCYVVISAAGAENWGQDDLGDEETIPPGDTRTFSVPAGTYDALALDCDQNTLYEEYDLDFTTAATITVQ